MKKKSKGKKKSEKQKERRMLQSPCGAGCPLLDDTVCEECVEWGEGQPGDEGEDPSHAVLD